MFKPRIGMAFAIALTVLTAGRAGAADVRIGDWLMGSSVLDATGFAIRVIYEHPKDKDDVRQVSINCRGDQYSFSMLGICRHCTSATQVPLRVTIDGSHAFDLTGIIEDDEGDLSKLMSNMIEAPLNDEQLRSLSQIKSAIVVEAPGYTTISLQPNSGTKAAFATLEAACTATRNDSTFRSQ
jgi:hypothetical protein